MALPMLGYSGLGPIDIRRPLARVAANVLLLHPPEQGCIQCPHRGCRVVPESDPSYRIDGLPSWEAAKSPSDPHSIQAYVPEGNLWIGMAAGNAHSGMLVFDAEIHWDFD